ALRAVWGDDLQRFHCAARSSRVPHRVSAGRKAAGADQRLVGALAARRRVTRAVRPDEAALYPLYSDRLSARAYQRANYQSARTGRNPAHGRMPRRPSPLVDILVVTRRSLRACQRQRWGDAGRWFESRAPENRQLLPHAGEPDSVGWTWKVAPAGRNRISQSRGA